MISRRNIREKVMQTLYAIESMQDSSAENPIKPNEQPERTLQSKLTHTANNFTASLLYIVKIAQYAEIDAGNRAAKLLPTYEDLHVNTKIAGNKYLWQLLENTTFQDKIRSEELHAAINEEWVRKLYLKLIETEKYKKYISTNSREDEDEKKMLTYIWKTLITKNEDFQDILGDEWIGYSEDKVLNRTLVDFYFKNPDGFNFYAFLAPEKEKYAKDLLQAVIQKKSFILDTIKPKLKNWDSERVALIDRILLEMGVAEFLYFPTIPTRVTINEYIEIAKDYSTEDSGRFVNAVLDNIVKDLTDQGMIRKQSVR